MPVLPPIVETVYLKATASEIWPYLATPEGLNKWFMPNDFIAQEGHEFTLQSPFGPAHCKVQKVIEHQFISFSWDVDGWFITLELKELKDNTAIIVTHDGWPDSATVISLAQLPAGVIHEKMVADWQEIVQNKLPNSMK
ncbi:SRPBCC family protein [Kurthia sibirica]|uniref:SRPBCC domain-containing protein n=1 Tax=Kurthia sibirica TaxID=202750 RepID=A0A2U3AND9_9BACL|nr:SRPBCC domain-containing protein [Kurthia sibirica]PWI26035.1 SRPBCC domain-containing protein [Kurthia sibirica]GEK34564.1 hypothetical protein KSI01_20970 [Kurthia sibirica]